MANKKANSKKKPFLKREYHLPLPDNKVGEVLAKPVKGPKPWQRLVAYIRESRNELKKVTWPSRRESIRLTIAVFVFTALFAAYTSVVDLGFEQVVERLFL